MPGRPILHRAAVPRMFLGADAEVQVEPLVVSSGRFLAGFSEAEHRRHTDGDSRVASFTFLYTSRSAGAAMRENRTNSGLLQATVSPG